MDICSQADRLDRKLEQLLLCLAEHLADHDGGHPAADNLNPEDHPLD